MFLRKNYEVTEFLYNLETQSEYESDQRLCQGQNLRKLILELMAPRF